MSVKITTQSLTYTAVLVYHPPPTRSNKSTATLFIDELSTLLSDITMLKGKLLLLGDFNIHVDNKDDALTKKLDDLLETFSLIQHVSKPTYSKSGHILDLLITRASEECIKNIKIINPGLSDHNAVMFEFPTTKPPFPRKSVSCRKYRSIDLEKFKADIDNSILSCPTSNDPDELVQQFHQTLTSLLDQHAPLKSRTIIVRPRALWFNEDIAQSRQRKRKAEKRWRQTGLEVHREIFTTLKNDLTGKIKKSKTEFIKNKINSSSNEQKALFKFVDELFYKTRNSVLPSTIPEEEIPDSFCKFFVEKVEKIQQSFPSDGAEEDSEVDQPSMLETFLPATSDQIGKLIKASASKSCSLDAIPTYLLKECLENLLPAITAIINASLSTSTVPQSFKQAVVSPLIKKATLDPDQLSNYRPVSNLNFISKILEKIVLEQLDEYRLKHNLTETYQSAYRKGHSTETAVLRVQNDILRAIDDGKCVFMVLLDLSAAFDTVSHHLLLGRLRSFGVSSDALEWIKSYLCGRTQSVKISGYRSDPVVLKYGVPQGSVLGPVFFTDYSSPVASIVRSHAIHVHCYADDTQLYIPFTPSADEDEVRQRLEACIEELRQWMLLNKLKLNDQKTEFIIFGQPSKLKKTSTTCIKVGIHSIKPSKSIRNIGAFMDTQLTMEEQVRNMTKLAWLNIFNISKIRGYLTQDQLKTIVHAYVTPKLDFNNCLLAGIPQHLVQRVQLVQNAAARLIMGSRKSDHVTPLLKELHWLPVTQRVLYKLLVNVYKALNLIGPRYLYELLVPYVPTRTLRSSSDTLLLTEPKSKLKRYGDRSFSVIAPHEWNKLPISIRSSKSLDIFKRALKTHLFKQHFTNA